MIKNELTLNGTIYNIKKFETSTGKTITSFGLGIYVGKDKDGKSKYGFINCKSFVDVNISEKQSVIINGYLTVETYLNKENKTISNVVIIAKTISDNSKDNKEITADEFVKSTGSTITSEPEFIETVDDSFFI